MGFKEWILPREAQFYDLLNSISAVLVRGAEALRRLVTDFQDTANSRREIKDLEHEGDEAVHETFEALNKTFITPFDREDISALASSMDNVMDMIYAAAVRLDLYKVESITPPMVELAEIILQSCQRVDEGVNLLSRRSKWSDVEALAVEINRLENQADDVLNEAIAGLFDGTDALDVIKLKDIYEKMELATDYCEDVADYLSDIAVKYR
jgi:predicted phosphate transport protein (TIGR00153 family)